jgi:hypothetical protein
LCNGLWISAGAAAPIDIEDLVITRLRVDGPRPQLADTTGEVAASDGDDPLATWGQALVSLLRQWL